MTTDDMTNNLDPREELVRGSIDSAGKKIEEFINRHNPNYKINGKGYDWGEYIINDGDGRVDRRGRGRC